MKSIWIVTLFFQFCILSSAHCHDDLADEHDQREHVYQKVLEHDSFEGDSACSDVTKRIVICHLFGKQQFISSQNYSRTINFQVKCTGREAFNLFFAIRKYFNSSSWSTSSCASRHKKYQLHTNANGEEEVIFQPAYSNYIKATCTSRKCVLLEKVKIW